MNKLQRKECFMRRAVFVFLVGILLLVCTAQIGFTPEEEYPEKKIKMSLDFSGQPESGNEFTITFSFTPLEEIEHKFKLPDNASIDLPEGVELVRGNIEWEGYLRKGVKHKIKIVAKATKPGLHGIFGVVQSCQLDRDQFINNHQIEERIAKLVFSNKIFYFLRGR